MHSEKVYKLKIGYGVFIMFEVYTVSFFGHRYMDYFRIAEDKVEDLIYKLLKEHNYVEFLVGRDGDFDQIATSAVLKAKHSYAEHRCDITWVMPYEKAEYNENAEDFNKYYGYVEVCSESAKVHPKQAIQVRNRYMVEKSDLIVFWVERNSGGAYHTMKYAVKQEKNIVNLAEDDKDR